MGSTTPSTSMAQHFISIETNNKKQAVLHCGLFFIIFIYYNFKKQIRRRHGAAFAAGGTVSRQ